jgi:hypothetical protein
VLLVSYRRISMAHASAVTRGSAQRYSTLYRSSDPLQVLRVADTFGDNAMQRRRRDICVTMGGYLGVFSPRTRGAIYWLHTEEIHSAY